MTLKNGSLVDMRDLPGAGHAAVTTLAGNLTLVDTDGAIQNLDPGGASRNVTLPAESTANHTFVIINSADAAEDLTVKNDAGTTIAIVGYAQLATFYPDGTNWKTDLYTVAAARRFVPLLAQLSSTSWDGDSHSTTAKTLIDLSSVFGAPAGVRAVLCKVSIRDSGSAASDVYIILSPNNSAGQGPGVACSGLTNDAWAIENLTVPCNANGDIYYQIAASGANTLDVVLEIWGYWI